MEYILVVLIAYLMGTSSMSYYLAKLNHVDIRNKGSKNLGASNAMILMGWKAGILVGVHDALKVMIPVCIIRVFFPEIIYGPELAGVAGVFGHVFPFYLGFKGGKGLASFIGMALGLNLVIGLIALVLLAVVTVVTDYIVLGTVTLICSVPLMLYLMHHDLTAVGIVLISSVLIAWKHRENYVRIYNGTEIRFRKANKGEYREKK
ncbi:MAG: glycerol-3-phosphate acyltransferase [Erysipelotrichaceae bacterium]|nr:glycerol-3-phosphate acyltransferase [Erysipelotrichaceae bacterium]